MSMLVGPFLTVGPGGHRNWSYRRVMPRISEDVVDCAVYLYHSEDEAKQGSHAGGSGFVLGIPYEPLKLSHKYVVTNKYVIEKAHAPVARLAALDGTTYTYDWAESDWLFHKTADLAIRRVEPDPPMGRFRIVNVNWLVTKDLIAEEGIGPGEEIYMVGRFIKHDGVQTNRAAVRFGSLAQAGTQEIDGEESFLVECHSIAGFSGSPVFVWIPVGALRPDKRTWADIPKGPWLLGVDWSHLRHPVNRRTGQATTTTDPDYVMQNSGMMGVVPAWKLQELLDELSDDRKRREAEWVRLFANRAASPDV